MIINTNVPHSPVTPRATARPVGMARRGREDQPGSWHHVVNRGIAKRPLFETRDDIRFFLSRIAREVRSQRIEVHCFSVMTTHFHFLVRSPVGELSEGLRRAQNAHSRRFNRRRRRDGALVRGRFFSKPVRDDRYRRTLVRYIDHNAVKARIVARAEDYEFGSARAYGCATGSPWLERSWVEAEACRISTQHDFDLTAYRVAFPSPSAEADELVERRLVSGSGVDPLVDLIGTTPPSVRRWMERKAQLADGHRPGQPVCTFGALRAALEQDGRSSGPWLASIGELTKSGEQIATVGLARDLAGHSFAELTERTAWSTMQLRRMAEIHRELIESDPAYAERAARVGAAAISAVLG